MPWPRKIAESGLYETLQFPFSYLADAREIALVETCARKDVGFIAMKGLAGGLITNAEAAMAFMTGYPNVLPIWGVQRASELEQWLAFMGDTPQVTPGMEAFFAAERAQLAGGFCRGCGYCAPCTVGIPINQAARMSLIDSPRPVRSVALARMAGEHGACGGLHRMRRLHDPLPLRPGHPRPAA